MTTLSEELAGLLAKATAGPWKVVPSIEWDFFGVYPSTGKTEFPIALEPLLDGKHYLKADVVQANFNLIVAAVNALPTLIAENAQLKAERDSWRAWAPIPEYQEEIERLTAERDEAREQFDNHVAWASNESAKLEETNARLSTELAAAREALDKAAVRFEHCAEMIAGSHAISGTLLAERTIKAKRYALIVRALLSGEKEVG